MKYTKSGDGKMRVTVRAEIRLEKEEYATLVSIAKESGVPVRIILRRFLYDGFSASCEDRDDTEP